MAPILILLMSSGSKKKEPRYACLSEVKASHSQRMWAEVLSPTLHLLYSGLSESPIRWRCLLRVLCPLIRQVTALDCVLLEDRNLPVAPRQGPETGWKLTEEYRINRRKIFRCHFMIHKSHSDYPESESSRSEMLTFIFKKYVVREGMSTGFVWLRIESIQGGEFLSRWSTGSL